MVFNMPDIFQAAAAFNHSLKMWNTSRVKDISGMFNNAIIFNQSISHFVTSNVVDMSDMFFICIGL